MTIKVIDLSNLPEVLALSMAHSDARAEHLFQLSSGLFTSFIRFPPQGKVPMHTHEGAHILWVTEGDGRLITPEQVFGLYVNVVYQIPSNTPHAIESGINGLSLLVTGDFYRPEDSDERLKLVE
jgi:quercetin dioxygenase-like cupin family protein